MKYHTLHDFRTSTPFKDLRKNSLIILTLIYMGYFDYLFYRGGGGGGQKSPSVYFCHLTSDRHKTWYDYIIG